METETNDVKMETDAKSPGIFPGLSFVLWRDDLLVLGAAASVALLMAWVWSTFREHPGPWRYEKKEERLRAAAERVAEAAGSGEATAVGGDRAFAVAAEVGLAEFREIVAGGKARVLDARPEIFYRLGHVPGAESLPREEFEGAYGRLDLGRSRGAALVVYCSSSSCEDAKLVVEGLRRVGHTNVGVFTGGWAAWTGAGYEEEGGR